MSYNLDKPEVNTWKDKDEVLYSFRGVQGVRKAVKTYVIGVSPETPTLEAAFELAAKTIAIGPASIEFVLEAGKTYEVGNTLYLPRACKVVLRGVDDPVFGGPVPIIKYLNTGNDIGIYGLDANLSFEGYIEINTLDIVSSETPVEIGASTGAFTTILMDGGRLDAKGLTFNSQLNHIGIDLNDGSASLEGCELANCIAFRVKNGARVRMTDVNINVNSLDVTPNVIEYDGSVVAYTNVALSFKPDPR